MRISSLLFRIGGISFYQLGGVNYITYVEYRQETYHFSETKVNFSEVSVTKTAGKLEEKNEFTSKQLQVWLFPLKLHGAV